MLLRPNASPPLGPGNAQVMPAEGPLARQK
jgi:hypothetical protein